MRAADRGRRATAVSLLAGVAAAGLLAEVRAAGAAVPGPRFEPGAFCTRSRCTTDPAPSWSGPLGFAVSALACIGLGRRRTGAPGFPRA